MATLESWVVRAVCYVIMLLGISLMIIGVILSDPNQVLVVLMNLPVPPFFEVGVMTLGLSGLCMVTACIGIAGSFKRSTCCLVLFIFSIILSGILQALLFAFAFRHSSSLKSTAMTGILEAMPLYQPYANETTEFMRKWDFEQEKHNCCGAMGWSDWSVSGSFPGLQWPDSCGEHPELVDPPRGCLQNVIDNPYVALILAAVAALALYIPEVLGIMSARHTIQTIKKRRKFERFSRATDAGHYRY